MPNTNKPTQSNFWRYLAVGYLVAFTVEYLSAASGDSKIFHSVSWPLFFLLWYGLLLTISWKIFRERPLWMVAVSWALLGPIIELLLFRGRVRVTDIFYCIIFVTPFWVTRRLG